MAKVDVDYSILQEPSSVGLVWGSAATWHCSSFIRWTRTLTFLSWHHDRDCLEYHYSYY